MSKRYPGNFITGNPVALSQTSNSGVWDLKDNYHATNNGTWQETDGIYEIGRSLRFRSSVTAYLNRTPIVAGNRKTWTWSAWVKRCNVSNGGTAYRNLFCAYSSGNTYSDITFAGTNQDRLRIYQQTGGGDTWYAEPNMYFRDTSAWYHIVVAFDTTLSAAGDRIKLYVNGVQQTFASYTAPAQNTDYLINSTNVHYINYIPSTTVNDMYMAETNFIDGQALDSSYFGYFDPITNIWHPKRYTGNYGTNGFYLPFSENQTLKNLGRNFGGGTNLCPYSESIGSWGLTNVSITSNSTTAPNGTTTADTITATSTAASFPRQDTGINVGISTHYTMSVYVKAASSNYVTVSDGYGTGAYVQVDLTNGTVINAYNPFGYQEVSVTGVGNGWYRIRNSFITHSGGDYNIGLRIEPRNGYGVTGSIGDSVHAWGGMINLGKTADPYFPNDVSTRADSNWTLNSFSLTDSMVDSPTNVFTTATDVGGVVPGNYGTLNPLYKGSLQTISNANLTSSKSSGTNISDVWGNFGMTSGKWYFECSVAALSATVYIGIGQGGGTGEPTDDLAVSPASYFYGSADGNKFYGNTGTAYGNPYTAGNVIGCAIDMDNGKIWWSRDGAWQASGDPAAGTNAAFTDLLTRGSSAFFAFSSTNGASNSNTLNWNFGQRQFANTPPAGFKSLNTTNLQALGTSAIGKAAITPHKWMDINLYGGTGAARDITNSGFQPDLVWIKHRSAAENHNLYDSARGPNVRLESNSADVQQYYADRLTSFNNNGFSLGGGYNNTAGTSYAAWQWKQSPTAGLNVITWTGTGTGSPQAISHNLGVTPEVIMCKAYSGASQYWIVHHKDMAGITYNCYLQLGDPQQADSQFTAKSSSSITVNGGSANAVGIKYVGYLFASVPGFSAFGTFSGNQVSDGPFVSTGFRPKFFMYKAYTHTSDWWILDTSRNSNNVAGTYFFANTSGSEGTEATWIDFLSNGIKLRGRTDVNTNGSDRKYIYMAFAESPFGLNNRAR